MMEPEPEATRGSGPEVDPEVWSASRGKDLNPGNLIPPAVVGAGVAVQQMCPASVFGALSLSGEAGEFGVHAAQALGGPIVVGIPGRSAVVLGAKVFDLVATMGDLCLGAPDVAGEPLDLVDGRRLFITAVTAELGQLPESRQAFFGVLEAVVGPVELLLGRRQREFGLPQGRAGVGGRWRSKQRSSDCSARSRSTRPGALWMAKPVSGWRLRASRTTFSALRWSAGTPPKSTSGTRVTFQVWVGWRERLWPT